jgi:hypothetical protein
MMSSCSRYYKESRPIIVRKPCGGGPAFDLPGTAPSIWRKVLRYGLYALVPLTAVAVVVRAVRRHRSR